MIYPNNATLFNIQNYILYYMTMYLVLFEFRERDQTGCPPGGELGSHKGTQLQRYILLNDIHRNHNFPFRTIHVLTCQSIRFSPHGEICLAILHVVRVRRPLCGRHVQAVLLARAASWAALSLFCLLPPNSSSRSPPGNKLHHKTGTVSATFSDFQDPFRLAR